MTEILREKFPRRNFVDNYFEVFWVMYAHFYCLKRCSFQVLSVLKSTFDWILARSLGTEFLRGNFHRYYFIECYFKVICVFCIKFKRLKRFGFQVLGDQNLSQLSLNPGTEFLDGVLGSNFEKENCCIRISKCPESFLLIFKAWN